MTPAEALKKLREQQDYRNAQEVFPRMASETKPRQKVDFWQLFGQTASKHVSGYKITPEIETLCRYFTGDKDFDKGIVKNTANIFKGLYVYGPYGTGKSLFFKIMHEIARHMVIQHGYSGLWFSSVTAPWIVEEYMRATEKDYTGSFEFTSYYKGPLYIDDLGMERLAFGRDNIIADLLFERHRSGAHTYITSNLSPKEFAIKYGPRLGDRMYEAFNVIEFTGKSMRE